MPESHTRFVALWRVQIESDTSTRSPSEYGKELPFAIADATADLRKSMATDEGKGALERRGGGVWVVYEGRRLSARGWVRGSTSTVFCWDI